MQETNTQIATASLRELLAQNPLFVFALESEAKGEFDEVDALFAGIGKVNAGYHLTKRIVNNKPSIIVNLGSAGSNSFHRGEVVCCTRFIQRDMDVTPLGFAKYETPLANIPVVLEYGITAGHLPQGICGTGDNFEVGHTTDEYNVIDMEAWPLAWIAQQENIPFLCLKYISDGADGAAAEDWSEAVHLAAEALKKVIDELRENC
ncbi:nucleosidase [Chitinophaga sp. Cy-1792]|uniref:5'-methylthioadenosine/S-adenosylhomocysteine nucleosidase family protein n=1 Tax=Chitinophaga sp. Cy-1792 TaxID=2608339 RepID=UPI00141E7405|nr:nucleosidase [Chitinophaga sp. Cy-1792]NIG53039.1 nucleosidase [Chitinophaga sp. Cy-1792]